jgi:hypothetical protein
VQAPDGSADILAEMAAVATTAVQLVVGSVNCKVV